MVCGHLHFLARDKSVKKRILFTLMLCGLGLLSACGSNLTTEEYIANGLNHFDQGDWKSAIIEFKNAVKTDPKDARARALLGQTYLNTRSADAAIKELTRAIELGYDRKELALLLSTAYRLAGEAQKMIDDIDPEDGRTKTEQAILYAYRGSALASQGERISAKEALETAKNLDGDATQVRLAWARFEAANRDIVAQEQWLQPLLERDGGVADAWSQMGVIEQYRGNPQAAVEAYTRAIEIRNLPHFDHVRRALMRVSLDDVDGAIEDVQYLRDSGANWPMMTYIEGLVDFRNKDYEAAQAHFLETQVSLPAYPAARLMTGLSYYYQQKYVDAATHLKQYLEDGSSNLGVSMVYASSLLASGESGEALKLLKALDVSNPNNYQILSLLSRAYRMQGMAEESLATLQRAVKLEPETAATRLQLGTSLLLDPATAAAGQRELQKALELDPDLENARYALYMSHIRQEEYDKALNLAKEIEQLSESKSLGANLVALVHLRQGDNEKARQVLLDTLKRYPGDVVTSVNLGQVYMSEGELDKARAVYGDVIEQSPNHIRSLEQLALVEAREGNFDDMMQWLNKAVERNPEQLRPKLVLAAQYLQHGKPSESLRVLKDVDVEAKRNTAYQILLARTRMSLQEYDSARRLLENLAERQPNLPVVHFLLAQVYAAGSDLEAARRSLEETIRIVPGHLDANLALARLDLQLGDEEAYDQRLAAVEKIHPGNSRIALLRAQKSGLDQDYDAAIRQLSEMLAESSQADVVKELARNQWRSGDRQGAIASLELWSESRKDSGVLLLLAELYLLEQRESEAAATYKELDRDLPENPAILNNLAWSLKDSDPEKGLEYARKANDLQPGNPLILDTLAMLQTRNGKLEQALTSARKAADLAPEVHEIQLNYAEILQANGLNQEARDVLNKLLASVDREDVKNVIRERLDSL